ncbi:SIS domain-containing protein [Dubosiella newyorkensis]|uniref:SIS domain-containing protein n=1 Tax=Dubosiella newyorkensis TaxID=1862672 RepID=UPI0023F4ED08|nr:SIS domain-containing protein [Dubosiella newyorkensis]
MQLMMAGTLSPEDCALIISHTGRNKDILRIADLLWENKIPMIVITNSISHLILIDTLFTLYAIKIDSDPEYFKRIRKIVNSTRQ